MKAMLRWPDERSPREEGRRALAALRESAAACELESDEDEWQVVSWPWTMARPIRIVLENEKREALIFAMDDDGIWTLTREPRTVRERSEQELLEDAWGEFTTTGPQPA